jgi:glycosyltransferase involved in cell wall biosynthesis
MRIAHVISTPRGFGGAEHVLATLVKASRERGWQILVLNPFASDPAHAEIQDAVQPCDYRGRSGARLMDLPGTRRWLRKKLKAFRPDLVHAHLFHASVLIATLRGTLRVPLMLSHQHGDHFERTSQHLLAHIDRVAGRRFNRIVACSESVRRFLLDRYRYAPERVVAIHNGWIGKPTESSGVAELPTVACVANFRHQKGHDRLLASFRRVVDQLPDARLVLVGEGPLESGVRARVRGLGLQGSVELTGAVIDVWPILEQAHVFALASRYEPMGIVVLEAMAAGVPVVAASAGGIPEILSDGAEGRLVPPGDEAAMAGAIVELLQDPAARAQMGAAGRRRAAGHHADRMAQRYLREYEGLVA